MRILMVDNEFPPLGGGMGTANQALLQCYAQRSDLEIDLITSGLDGTHELEHFAKQIRIIKVPVWNRNIHHSTWRELLLFAVQAARKSLQYHRSRPYDFCFAWSTVPAGAVALAVQHFTALPYAVWVSGPDIPGFEQRYNLLYPFLSPIIRRVWRKATYVIAKCAGEMEMIHAIDHDVNLRFIPNGVDLKIFRPGPVIPDDGPLNVICVARLIERKGQDQLIKAVKRLSDEGFDVTLSLVGTGDSQPWYKDYARRMGVQDRVRFEGYVPREQINSYYDHAHVFALPSFNEGMSLAALEAMATGLPLLVTRTGGTEELVQEGVNGFTFAWKDNDQLTSHLRILVKDRALARRMGAMSRARAASFGWDEIAAGFLDLFNQMPLGSAIQKPLYLRQKS
jgi:glycosyltransferase involved in cell wall biosynthesis